MRQACPSHHMRLLPLLPLLMMLLNMCKIIKTQLCLLACLKLACLPETPPHLYATHTRRA